MRAVDWAADPRVVVAVVAVLVLVAVEDAKDGFGEMVVVSRVSVAALAAEFVHAESMERRETTTAVSSVVGTIKTSPLMSCCCCPSLSSSR